MEKHWQRLLCSEHWVYLSWVQCERRVKETSNILYEDVLVSDVIYDPGKHGSSSGLTFTPNFDNGEIGMGFTYVDVNIPEKYVVVFQC